MISDKIKDAKVLLSGTACLECVFEIGANFVKRNNKPRDKGIIFYTNRLGKREICPICGKIGNMVEFECIE